MTDESSVPAGSLGNVPEYSVSELSNLLKRKLEDAFPLVRVKGSCRRLAPFERPLLFRSEGRPKCWAR
jgi:hypothetical protein